MQLPGNAQNNSARNLKKMVHDYHEQLTQPAGATPLWHSFAHRSLIASVHKYDLIYMNISR